jgi:8-oxo-dGTP pyrophosphatase MutT (NUDIX family)
MHMPETATAPTPVPAATVLILRDSHPGLEVFMVKRHHQIDFVAGALVFPGGKVHADDCEAGLNEYASGARNWTAEMRAFGAAAIREAFEESGILLARDDMTNEFVDAGRLLELDGYRHRLEKSEITLLDVLRAERLHLAYDALVPFAHWITPEHMPKRFDTHFFLAPAPPGHAGAHDGRESVDSVWIRPEDAIADRKKWNVIFPTKLNLMKLAPANSVAEAIAIARANPPLTVTPWVEQTAEGPRLRIREDAGYAQTSTLLRDAL